MRHVIVTTLFCAFIGSLSAGDKVTINVRQPDGAIRQQLLELTPLGTPAERVFQFLQVRLHRDGEIVGRPGQPYRSAMSVYLGHYFEPRNLFMFPTVVQAFWDFDQHDKLRDIRVRRVVSGM